MWGPGMWGPRHVAGSQHMRIEAPIAPSVASRLWASTRLGGCRLLNVHERAAGGATCSLRQVSVDCQPRAWVGRLSHEGSRPRHEGRWAGPGPLGRSGRSAGRAAGQAVPLGRTGPLGRPGRWAGPARWAGRPARQDRPAGQAGPLGRSGRWAGPRSQARARQAMHRRTSKADPSHHEHRPSPPDQESTLGSFGATRWLGR